MTGYRKTQLLAQETARRIKYECELFEMTPAERQAVDLAAPARRRKSQRAVAGRGHALFCPM